MPTPDVPYLWKMPARPGGANDAYSGWSNAQERCTQALRAWQAALPADRAIAYHVYVAALDHEEAAAAELARLQARLRAA